MEDAFIGCMDEEDTWKLILCYFVDGVLYENESLSLCYFVDGVIYANESQTKVDMCLFSLVENEDNCRTR